MRIKKLADGSVLEAGQLRVVLHCLNQCGSDALGGLRKSIGAGSFNFIGIARRQFHGLADRRTADCSDARKQRMSGGLTSATRRLKKSSYLTASPLNSGKNEIRIGCPTLMTIYPFGISEAGKSIAEHSERPEAASTAESTALPSGLQYAEYYGWALARAHARAGYSACTDDCITFDMIILLVRSGFRLVAE